MKYLFLAFLFILPSCSKNNGPLELPDSKLLAVVGNQEITQGLLQAYISSNALSPTNDTEVAMALDSLIGEVAMANIATKKKLNLSDQQRNTIYYLNLRTHSQNAQRDYLQSQPVSTQDAQNEYEKIKTSAGGHEYYVHHMLFDDEIEAINMLESIKSSSDYLSYEVEYMNSSNKTGVGELGWVNLKQLPKSFGDVLPTISEDSVAPTVIQSQFGAHVLYLKQKREFEPPSFDEVKDGILNSLKAKRLSKFKQISVAKAKVRLNK